MEELRFQYDQSSKAFASCMCLMQMTKRDEEAKRKLRWRIKQKEGTKGSVLEQSGAAARGIEMKGGTRSRREQQPGSSVCAASCENRLMQPAAELHRVLLLGTSTRHMPHCCEALGPSSHPPALSPFVPFPRSLAFPSSLGSHPPRALRSTRNKCTPGRAAI